LSAALASSLLLGSLLLASLPASADPPLASAEDTSAARSLPPALSSAKPSAKQLARAKRLFEQGLSSYEKGDFTAAAKFLLKAHAITPSPELAYNLGRIYERMDDAARAVPLLRGYLQSGKVSKDEAADLERRIAALEARAAKALAPLSPRTPSERVLQGQARSLFEHGIGAFRNQDFEAARSAFASAHDLTPLPELAWNLALACERLGRTRDAADHFTTYLALQGQKVDPEEATLLNARIRALRVAAPKATRSAPTSAASR
jgi:tetratricopeptide (TPR) repeat protein